MCTSCVPSTVRGQKKVSDPLKPELQMVVCHYSELGTGPGSSTRAHSAPNHLATSSAPSLEFL